MQNDHKKVKKDFDMKKREGDTELPDELLQENKQISVSFLGAHAAPTADTDIPVEVNQDEEEKKTELRLFESQLLRDEPEFPAEKLIPAMHKKR